MKSVDKSHWMFRTLDGIPSRAIVDTNILLDATLIADGFGAKALSALRERGITLYVDDTSFRDAQRVLGKRTDVLSGSRWDSLIASCCKRHAILSAPPGNIIPVGNVNRPDRHLARAAATLDAFIVTDDAPLIFQLQEYAIESRTSREIILQSYGGSEPPMIYVFSGLNLGSRSGFIFVRCVPDHSVINGPRRESTLWEGRSLGRFYYDCERRAFVFSASWTDDVILPFRLSADQQFVLLVNLNLPRRGPGSIAIRAAAAHPVIVEGMDELAHHCSVSVSGRPPQGFGDGELRILNSYALGNGWSGHIQCMAWGPRRLSADAWKTFRSVPGTAPNPCSSDLLDVCLSLFQQQGDFVRVPSLMEVLAKAGSVIKLEAFQ